MTPRIAAVVLAAGSSSRMGRAKQLIEFEGQTLIRRTALTVLASQVDALVVTMAAEDIALDRELAGLKWIRADVANASLGQSESVRAGLKAVMAQEGFDAILFTPCDLPLLSVEHLNALVDEYRSRKWKIVTSRYDGILGAPLILGNELWPELYGLRGDTGVRKILGAHTSTLTSIPWEDGQLDLDTPGDVQALMQMR